MRLRPLIGISCGTEPFDEGTPTFRDRLNAAYSASVYRAGGQPVILPNVPSREDGDLLSRLDGVLFSGGLDVHPNHYRCEIESTTVELDLPRDDAELPFLRACLQAKVPLICICRGVQSLNIVLGGTLWQDQPSQHPTGLNHRQTLHRSKASHAIRVDAGSMLEGITGPGDLDVNSFHHQAIRDLAPGLTACAWAPDGIIEAVSLTGAPFVLGVQFHPEEMAGVCERQHRLFAAHVDACRK